LPGYKPSCLSFTLPACLLLTSWFAFAELGQTGSPLLGAALAEQEGVPGGGFGGRTGGTDITIIIIIIIIIIIVIMQMYHQGTSARS
jgi:uncharacterized membrane protein